VNIWREIERDGAGLADEDSVEGVERLLRRWFNLLPEEHVAMTVCARRCFEARYSMTRTVAALDSVFTSTQSNNSALIYLIPILLCTVVILGA